MAKRSHGEGTIRRRSDGRWECRIMDGYRDDGRPYLHTFYGRTPKEVREKLNDLIYSKDSYISFSNIK